MASVFCYKDGSMLNDYVPMTNDSKSMSS